MAERDEGARRTVHLCPESPVLIPAESEMVVWKGVHSPSMKQQFFVGLVEGMSDEAEGQVARALVHVEGNC